MIPVNTIIKMVRRTRLLATGKINRPAILHLFDAYYYLCAVSKAEDVLLNKKYSKTMPPEWDGADIFARYRACGVTVLSGSGHISSATRAT